LYTGAAKISLLALLAPTAGDVNNETAANSTAPRMAISPRPFRAEGMLQATRPPAPVKPLAPFAARRIIQA
jgi:hypothetical protein